MNSKRRNHNTSYQGFARKIKTEIVATHEIKPVSNYHFDIDPII